MGWLDGIINKVTKKTKYAQMLNGYTPIFSQFGNNVYASDVVQQAISCIVSEMKKLRPCHTRGDDEDVIPVKGSIQRVLNNPNQIMTGSDFIEKIMWMLMLHYNAFIIPTYDSWHDADGNEHRNYTGLYPVQPTIVTFEQDEGGTLWIRMKFLNDYETVLPYSDVIHLKYRFSINDFMGGNSQGEPDNKSLLKTLEINHDMMQGISGAMKSSFAINGVVNFNTMLDGGKTEAALKELEEKLKNSESGFLPLDLKASYSPISKNVKLVDADTLKFIDEKILRTWGVPLCILTGDYTKEQYEAFYQKTLEPLIVCLCDEFTRVMFTPRERSFGNKIMFYPKKLIFMSTDQTLEMIRLLGDSGSLYENEKRVAFGLNPLIELKGVRMQSLNYVDVNIADKYQVGSDTSDVDEQTEPGNKEEQKEQQNDTSTEDE